MNAKSADAGALTPAVIARAAVDGLWKLDPRQQVRRPVMFLVWVGAAVTSALVFAPDASRGEPRLFVATIAVWLWATVWFGSVAEAVAEGRGKARAASLRAARRDVTARREREGGVEEVSSSALRVGDVVHVIAGEVIPLDGVVIAGCASVDESAITGESAPVVREAGGDRDAVTGGTRVLSDELRIEIRVEPGASFLDRMIALVEGSKRRKTPTEISLDVLLAGLSLVFLLATVTLRPIASYVIAASGSTGSIGLATLVALLICLAPTTIGALLTAIGIAGMDRMVQANVVATSGRAVETAGDVDVLLLDKTGTITFGNRQAAEIIAAPGVAAARLAEAAGLASIADTTPEGKSLLALVETQHGLTFDARRADYVAVPFSARTRMSGVDTADGRRVRKGAADTVATWVVEQGGTVPSDVQAAVDRIARSGGTPLVVAEGSVVLGVVYLKDVLKPGMRQKFEELRRMSIRTVMITGDNPLTAAAIAAEAGVDDFRAQATPETKLELIRQYQADGHVVAMTGDGTNDAPALAQADVAVAMGTGTQAAKEAGNMVDLDSDPTKLTAVVEIGKQMLITRGALTTFSLSNDIAKYFAIVPAAFATVFPAIGALNVMGLDPRTAVVSAVVFNALIIVALIPIALRGVTWRPASAAALLRRNLLVYGLGGIVVPFVGIKVIDLVLSALVGAV